MEFCDKIKVLREKAGLSQQEVAKTVGVAKSTYSLYEAGKREPDVLKIKAIALALNTTPDDLLDIKNSPLSELDSELIEIYKILGPEGKARLVEQARLLREAKK